MLKIRLQRVGRKNHAEFRVVVAEHARAAKKSNFVEILGSYNPHGGMVTLNDERVRYWLGKGAQASDTVHNFLVKKGVLNAKKKAAFAVKPPKAKEEAAPAESAKEDMKAEETVPVEETPAEEVTSPSEDISAEEGAKTE